MYFPYIIIKCDTYLHINICEPQTITTKNISKTQEKPNSSWLFQVPSKTLLNTKSPLSHNLNPTLTKTCVFHRVNCSLGIYLCFI